MFRQSPRAGDGHARWYVIHTQPSGEARAVAHLGRQDYSIFFPRRRAVVRHARKRRQILAPLFPGYLFVKLDLSRDFWRSINGTRGVVRLLTQGDTPLPVPAGIVETLLARIDADGAIDWAPLLSVGQPVRVAEGAFTDCVGTLARLDTAGRVCMLLELLGRSVPVKLRAEALDPAA